LPYTTDTNASLRQQKSSEKKKMTRKRKRRLTSAAGGGGAQNNMGVFLGTGEGPDTRRGINGRGQEVRKVEGGEQGWSTKARYFLFRKLRGLAKGKQGGKKKGPRRGKLRKKKRGYS